MNQQLGSSAKQFSKIIIIKKTTNWGIRLFVLADSDTGYVHSIIPNYGKPTGAVRNLPYSEKPFISRIVLSLDRV
jgi:hypothetical protein